MTGSTIGVLVGKDFCALFGFDAGLTVGVFLAHKKGGWVGLNIEYLDLGFLVGLHIGISVDAKTGIVVIFFTIKSRLLSKIRHLRMFLDQAAFFLNLKE